MQPYNRCESVCRAVGEPNPLCGTVVEHLPVEPFASSLCINALAGRIRGKLAEIEEDSRPSRRAALSCDVGWCYLELGMAETDEAQAETNFTEALRYADEAMRDPYTSMPDILPAALMTIYTPIFKAHKEGPAPDDQAIAELYHNLGAIFDGVRAAPLHGPASHISEALLLGEQHAPCFTSVGDQQNAMARLLLNMVTLRGGVRLLPASNRESKWSRSSATSKRHDLYGLEGKQKSPIKVGTRSKAGTVRDSNRRIPIDEGVTFVNFAGVVNLAEPNMLAHNRDHHNQLLEEFGGRPGIMDLGLMLRAEMGGSASNASLTFIETVTMILFDQMGYATQKDA